jgi:hypothetical protein
VSSVISDQFSCFAPGVQLNSSFSVQLCWVSVSEHRVQQNNVYSLDIQKTCELNGLFSIKTLVHL